MHQSLIRFTLLLTLGLLALLGWRQCANRPAHQFRPGFYYWKTSMRFDSNDWQQLTRFSGNEPLYLRMFDVDYSAGYNNAVPVGGLSPQGSVSDGRQVIPTVFITNRVFEQLSDSLVMILADKVRNRIVRRLEDWRFNVSWQIWPTRDGEHPERNVAMRDSLGNDWMKRCNEIQIDCDWTAATRDRYFKFLRAFRQRVAPARVSCTVRLHQYRDRAKSGIPPVDRGMLMCYNVADPKQESTSNAIFDPALIKGYLKASTYPLPLDVALPLFSWGAWFRDGDFKGLLGGWDERSTTDKSLFQAEGGARYRVLQDTVIGQDYLREGDLLRIDQSPVADLPEMAALLGQKLRSGARLVFFDWQTDKIKTYEKVIQDCTARFQ